MLLCSQRLVLRKSIPSICASETSLGPLCQSMGQKKVEHFEAWRTSFGVFNLQKRQSSTWGATWAKLRTRVLSSRTDLSGYYFILNGHILLYRFMHSSQTHLSMLRDWRNPLEKPPWYLLLIIKQEDTDSSRISRRASVCYSPPDTLQWQLTCSLISLMWRCQGK